jgi:hypothetical protein
MSAANCPGATIAGRPVFLAMSSVASAVLLLATGHAAGTNLTTQAELGLGIGYDSNVYLQDVDPDPAGVAQAAADGLEVVRPNQGSLVATVQPRFSLAYAPGPALQVSAGYSPELVYYTEEPSENHVVHRGTLGLGGAFGKLTWELPNTFIYIDGGKLGPTFGLPGDIPAIGGVPLRDRREAFIFRNSFKASYPVGKFLLRPVATAYLHDFRTEQRPSGTGYRYENYIDRQEVAGGLDLGYAVADRTYLLAGYRFGAQEQHRLLGVDSPYDNHFHRFLLGAEGSPWPWLRLAVLAGPDLRVYHDDRLSAVAPAFQKDELLVYVDALVTVKPTARDTVTLLNRRYQQPAFASPSMYEDITYDVTWRRQFDPQWSARTGFRIYVGDWQGPVNREDWIYTVSAGLAWAPVAKVTAELGYGYDWVESRVPNTVGREFTRHVVALNVKYAF